MLVILSLVVAVLASYTALMLAERVYMNEPRYARWWRLGGACVMGLGIWSMHFIGMMAYSLPIALAYDWGWTLFSLAIAIGVSYFALWQVTHDYLSKSKLLSASILMGVGISSMHYTGMEAMQIFPRIQYHLGLLALSVLVAMVASGVALQIVFRLREHGTHQSQQQKRYVISAIIMGTAIAGMHYIGMAAAQFSEGSICRAVGNGIEPKSLDALVGLGSLIVLFVANLTSNFSAKNAYLIKSLETVNQQLKEHTLYDSLTQLPNRVLLEESVMQRIKQASQHQSLFYMALDIDGFKTVNDSLGAHIGDALLKAIAVRLRNKVPEQYIVARSAGNEFVVVMDGSVSEAAEMAQRVLADIRAPFVINHHELMMTASMGIAAYPADGLSYPDLAFFADAAMQFIKRTGKNGYKFYEVSMNANAARKLDLVSNLRNAIASNQLTLYFEPKFDLASGQLVGAEALLRWHHPTLGFIPPAEFIPIAEEAGLIVELDRWVLNQACQQLQIWRAAGFNNLNVSVNVSAAQFANTEFLTVLIGTVSRWEIPYNALTIEVTETTAMRNPEESLSVLAQLAELGVRVSIDDFGTGYSSLLYLKRLPANELKIDRGFVELLGQDHDDERIVSAVIVLGHQFGMQVVAEGVETEAQQQMLANLGCDIIQGHLFGNAEPAEAFIQRHQHKIAPTHRLMLLND